MIARREIVRVFIDVPEDAAGYVSTGSKAVVCVPALQDREISATVMRTSGALSPNSRTLRAEIDLANPDGKMLPGMYAYAKVIIERVNVRCLPNSAVHQSGDQTCCYLL